MDLSTWLTKQQVAAALGVSEKTVTRMAARGELKEQIRKVDGAPPRPVYDPNEVAAQKAQDDSVAEAMKRFPGPQKLLPAPAVPEPAPKAKPLPLSELRFKAFLTTDEAVRYSGLPEAVLVDLAENGAVSRFTNMKPYRYSRTELERLDTVIHGQTVTKAASHIPGNQYDAELITLNSHEACAEWNTANPGDIRKLGDTVRVRKAARFEAMAE